MRATTLFSFVRSVALIAAGLVAVLGLGLALDLARSGQTLSAALTWNVTEARQITNILDRNFNQLIGVVFTTVSIAVPLTANLYSLKFLEFFIKDRVNTAVLFFVVFAALANTWTSYGIKDGWVPLIELIAVCVLMIAGYALLIPYLFYVFRFLHPNALLSRLEAEGQANLRAALRRPGPQRAEVAATAEHLANMAIRSVERADRNTAVESVLALERGLRDYWTLKPQLAPAWFEADQSFFLGFSSAAVDDLTGRRTWVEMKVFGQLQQIIGAAIGRMPELTSTAAKALRKLGLEPAARADPHVRELVTEYFNTLLRLALNRRDPRALFTIIDQYRLFAEAINADDPALGLEIAYYFRYYGHLFRDTQQVFAAEAIAYDLGRLVQAAWQAGAPNRAPLLDRFLHYEDASPTPFKGVKKAQAILASYFLMEHQPEPADLIRAAWAGLDPAFVRQVRDDLLAVTHEIYWEVTERRLNLDYVSEPQRAHLTAFFARLDGAG